MEGGDLPELRHGRVREGALPVLSLLVLDDSGIAKCAKITPTRPPERLQIDLERPKWKLLYFCEDFERQKYFLEFLNFEISKSAKKFFW